MEAITDIEKDFSAWYTDVVQGAQLADYAPIRGCMVIRPYGYAIWEIMQAEMDRRIKETGHQNAYFPMFIPEKLLNREADHVEGFRKEGVRISSIAGEPLEEELVVRFSSEAVIMDMFAKWIQSHRDLPMKLNQWCNVVRWEMRPRLFLRTSEFLWHEGHTAHATEQEAREETLLMLKVYQEIVEGLLAISPVPGRKTEREKFAGAEETYTIEGLMRDGKALQMGTSHYFGQRFARAFGIRFQDKQGQLEHVYTTSWAMTTRLIGAVIMSHGDGRGLVLPPRLAPIQAMMVPIVRKDTDREALLTACRRLVKESGVRCQLDEREELSPGAKYHEWELKGVPMRLELGPRDLEQRQLIAVERFSGQRHTIAWDQLGSWLPERLEQIQREMLEASRQRREKLTHSATSLEQLVQQLDSLSGFVRINWCGSEACEEQVKVACKATSRCILGPADAGSCCAICGSPAEKQVLFARAY